MAGTLIPAPFTYFTDDEGAPLSGGTVEIYLSGTSTPASVYHDALLADPWDNPLTIPADGKVTMYQDADTLKMVVKDADGVVLQTIDPIQSTTLGGGGGTGGILFNFAGDDYFPITTITLPTGTGVDTLHPGTSLLVLDSANLVGDYVLQGMMQAAATDSVHASLVNLSQGLPNTPIVSIASSSATGELQTSSVITFAASGTDRTYAVKTRTSTGICGYVWALALVRV